MIVDIFNEVYTMLKTTIPESKVLTAYPQVSASFPLIILSEIENVDDTSTVDSHGVKYVGMSFEVNIFTNSDLKVIESKSLRKKVDSILGNTYGMRRYFANTVENYIDPSIYRYIMRYSFKIDESKTVYRR